MLEFHVAFTVEHILTANQHLHNANKLVLFDPRTKWKGNKLPSNDLNCVNADCMTVHSLELTLMSTTNVLEHPIYFCS